MNVGYLTDVELEKRPNLVRNDYLIGAFAHVKAES